jgi:hypothetical protein
MVKKPFVLKKKIFNNRHAQICEHTYKINDSIIRIFSGLSTRLDCKDAFESHINVGPNIIAKFLASI